MAEELTLHAIPREELLTLIRDALYEGDEDTVVGAIEIAVVRDIAPRIILSDGLAAGVDRIGLNFGMREEGASVVALQAGMAVLRPHFTRVDGSDLGTMVIGTMKGNGHDVSKDLVAMMMQCAGFTVHDIGVNNSLGDYLEAVETYTPDILVLCGHQSWTMPYTRVVIEVLRQEGFRDDLLVIVGGAPLQGESIEQFGVDAYCYGPVNVVETAQRLWLAEREEEYSGKVDNRQHI